MGCWFGDCVPERFGVREVELEFRERLAVCQALEGVSNADVGR